MKKTYCIDCKWMATRWFDRTHFCHGSILLVPGESKVRTWLKPCSQLNCDGQCALYSPGWRMRLAQWIRRK